MRLRSPLLGDGDWITITVVVEGDYPAKRVGDGRDLAEAVVVNGQIVAVAIFDLSTAILAVGF